MENQTLWTWTTQNKGQAAKRGALGNGVATFYPQLQVTH
jgi:hypothetical protein